MEEFEYGELQSATDDFSLSALVGKGSHGCVYKGVLGDGKLVAIKKPSIGLQILRDNSKLDNEIEVLSSLHRSPYLVNLVGVSHDGLTQKKLLVMEFMPNGSLHDSLHNMSTPPSWSKRLHVALQVARAVQTLHEARPSIIHRDIKSANILFDSNWNAKLADFGLAVRQNESTQPVNSPSQPAGTIGYLDPCYTTPGKLSTRIDVFSFGVVLLEMISCRRAIDARRDPASIVEWALSLISGNRGGLEVCDTRIALPGNMEGTIRCILNVAAQCVSSKEECRPSMAEIVSELENCMVRPIRYPVWRSLLRSVLSRRKRKATTRTTTIICTTHQADVHVDHSRGKLLVREVLAEVSFN
ncbi:serine/threonine-protein kinase-like protein At5g23170 [Telopea speciosissima]|uniref:serine/threonine-protein kinase-like protein At5g23170 n=1 Tax=Telopea speciosissima TaxID=54955 RepID=UPI001CC6BFF8|nr:serine/threonine-protein kinase-like protein At5g23170 [Telopea speciosissima]